MDDSTTRAGPARRVSPPVWTTGPTFTDIILSGRAPVHAQRAREDA